ncbi:CPBP family intramembrane glutamic endopeptidase [Dyella tabacisoli]|uniref:CPBP family intramembrane metalloprotease n=1 Tax=Dyella tabacisoli TaxID=2282381 RepID=A0A369UTR7_9GAMM|nr:type II CAAX endopeptidase family protein [Dyella tabacisoli]RDD83703.1 CPBP family intramembrane metalloprotease [Dyella tabacisoli]
MDVPRADPIPPASWPPYPLAQPSQPNLYSALGLIGLYFVLQLVIGAVVGLFAGLLTGTSRHGQNIATATSTVPAILVQADVNALMVIITLIAAAGCILYLARRLWPAMWPQSAPPGLGFAPPSSPSFYVAALLIGVTMPIIGGLLTQFLAGGHAVTQDIKQLGADTSLRLRIPLALIVISIGPLVEELLFRGALLSALLRRLHAGWATALCALLFAAIHLPDLGFLWYALPNLALLGAALVWLRLRSGSIWPAVLAHGANNMLAVLAWFVMAPPSS